MAEKKKYAGDADDLRRRADEAVSLSTGRTANDPQQLTAIQRLAQELRVHAVELDMQNEELLRAHQELENSKAKYFDLYDMAPMGYCTINNHGLIMEANLAAVTMLGVPRSAFVNQFLSSFVLSEDKNTYYQFRKLLVEAGTPQPVEMRLSKKDGKVIWVSMEAAMSRNAEGELVTRVVMNDIAERKKVEAEIQDAREFVENIVETVREPLVVLSSDLKIISVNHSFYDTFKVKPEETIGKLIYDIGNRQWDIPTLRELLENILPLNTVFNGYKVEHDFITVGRKTMLLNARQIFRESIGSRFILLAMEDITVRKQAEEQVARSLKEKEVLLKEINHRVKNNMTVIYSLLNLQANATVDKAARAVLEEARDRVNMMALIHQKLYQSKDLAHIDYKEYLQNLVAGIVDTYQRRDIVLSVEMESVFFDVTVGIPCGLIVNELVSNALKYAFPEGRKGTITVGINKDSEGNNVLTVADNGIGFPETTDFNKTTTLGLQLVNGLSGQIHGTIELSRVEGTTFRITFPGTTDK